MQAIRYRHYGEPAAVLVSEEVADLQFPAADQLLVRVTGRAVHPGDLIGVRGLYRSPGDVNDVAAGGATPGFEGVGVIEAIGSTVDKSRGLSVGQRVMFFPGRAAWSERVLVSAEYANRVPDDISDVIASQLHVTPLTAVLLLRAAIAAGAADDNAIVLTAGGSAVARLVAILARRRGIHVVSVVRRQEGAEVLRGRLPDIAVVATDQPDWKAQVEAAIGGRKARALLDPVGGTIASELADLLSNGGTVLSYGDLSREPISITALAFSVRGISIRGVSVGGWASLPSHQRREDVSIAIDLARTAPEQFDIEEAYPFAMVKSAVLHAERAGKAGAVLLTS